MAVAAAVSPFAFGAAAAAQCVTVDPLIVPDVRFDPLDATGAAQLMQPVTMTFRRVGPDTGPLRVTYQIVDEDSGAAQRIGLTAGPQVEWRSGDSGRNIGAARNEAWTKPRPTSAA